MNPKIKYLIKFYLNLTSDQVGSPSDEFTDRFTYRYEIQVPIISLLYYNTGTTVL